VANISNDNSEIGEDIHEVANYLWKVISPILLVIGVGGNAGIMIILYKINVQDDNCIEKYIKNK
jgi:hypothetical protein